MLPPPPSSCDAPSAPLSRESFHVKRTLLRSPDWRNESLISEPLPKRRNDDSPVVVSREAQLAATFELLALGVLDEVDGTAVLVVAVGSALDVGDTGLALLVAVLVAVLVAALVAVLVAAIVVAAGGVAATASSL